MNPLWLFAIVPATAICTVIGEYVLKWLVGRDDEPQVFTFSAAQCCELDNITTRLMEDTCREK